MIDRPNQVAKETVGVSTLSHADKLDLAIAFATMCHKGQTDKIGNSYILHPLRLMMAIEKGSYPHKLDHMLVAVLHDTIEDAPQWWDTAEGSRLRFELSEAVMESIFLLSRDPDEDYTGYVLNIKKSKSFTAMNIKILDLKDNLHPGRMAQLGVETQVRLRKKYNQALDILGVR